MNIEKLLDKYFEGETSCEEERKLRRYFTQNIMLQEHLQTYRPLFAYLDIEIKHNSMNDPKRKAIVSKRTLMYMFGGIAAGLLLILGISGINQHHNIHSGNYVLIDGKQYTDINLVRELAMSAFTNVCFSQEEIFDTLFEE
ncbi:hypothetical protein EZS27_003848 [termite gut metagenome]|uniref:Uncharacterized protein n=1 Tax=termite gut metagenome TaxID=433724 RepID=A0A5J4SRB0_9ZZZZ